MMVLPIAGEGNESFTSKEVNLFSQFLNSRLTKFLMILDMMFFAHTLAFMPSQIGGHLAFADWRTITNASAIFVCSELG